MNPPVTKQIRRLAIFVEGRTEMLFTERLVTEVAGQHNVRVEKRKISGGRTVPRQVVTLQSAPDNKGELYFVLIFDCQGDQQVATRIREEHQNLSTQGYEKIIGLRDVRPTFQRHEIEALRAGLNKYVDKSGIPVEFVLSAMEIEAWFLAEYSHFILIDPRITIAEVKRTLAFDPSQDVVQLDEPAKDLNNVYGIGGAAYEKGGVKTVEKLDYAFIYTDVRSRVPQIDQLLTSLDKFLS